MKLLAALLLLIGIPALGQTPGETTSNWNPVPPLFRTDAIPPPMCALYIVQASSVTVPPATKAYTRLVYVTLALESALKSAKIFADTPAELAKAADLTHLLATISENGKQAVEAVRCSADIMGNYTAIDETDELMKKTFIISFNQSAEALEALRQSQLTRFSTDQTNISPSQSLKEAQDLTAIFDEQRDAASSLIQSTTLGLLATIEAKEGDTSTHFLLLGCKEYADILKREKPLAALPTNNYQQAAALIKDFVLGHRCKYAR